MRNACENFGFVFSFTVYSVPGGTDSGCLNGFGPFGEKAAMVIKETNLRRDDYWKMGKVNDLASYDESTTVDTN